MGEWNDGLAISINPSGSFKIVDNDDFTPSYLTVDREIGSPGEFQSLTNPFGVARIDNESLSIRSLAFKEFDFSTSYKKPVIKLFLDTLSATADVSDELTIMEVLKTATAYSIGDLQDISVLSKRQKANILRAPRKAWCMQSRYSKVISFNEAMSLTKKTCKVIDILPAKRSVSFTEEPKYCINESLSISDDIQPIVSNVGSNILLPITVNVEDYKPPAWGNTGSGSGVQSVRFVVQKYAFSEIYLQFSDTKVLEVQGLPQGLFFEKSYIKGTPLTSGTYPIKMKLDNLRTLEGLLIVPEIPRQL